MASLTFSLLSSVASSIAWGWDETLNLGTTGDYFVDAVNGDDLNAGSSTGAAFATIQKAVTTVGSGNSGIIRVMGDGVKYRETVNMVSGTDSANRIEILAYGTDRPVLTGGEQITGWTQCTSADEGVVGSNFANIYKVTGVTKTDIMDSSVLDINLFENNQQLQLCLGWAGADLGDKFFLGNPKDGYTADTTNVDGSNNILSYTDTSVTSAFTSAQIENCYVFGHTSPNVGFLSTVSSVSGSTIILSDQTNQYEDNDNKDKYALLNLLPSLEQGQYGFVDNGTTIDIYCWPNNAANLTSGMEYCARTLCIDNAGASNWTVKGIRFQQVSGSVAPSNNKGCFILNSFGSGGAENVTIENNYFYGKFGISSLLNTGAITLRAPGTLSSWKIHNNGFDHIQGSTGFNMNGGANSGTPSASTLNQNLDIQQNKFTNIGGNGVSAWSQEKAVVAHNYFEKTGAEAHGNKITFYEQCHNYLMWGNVFVDTDGYATPQEASAGHILFNYFLATRQADSNSARAFVDQNNATTPPSDWKSVSGETLFANNACLPQPIGYDGTASNSIDVTSSDVANDTVSWTVLNNLYHGHVVPEPTLITEWKGNWNTGPDGNYTTGNTSANGADVYNNPSAGDFTIKAGAAIRSATGESLSAKITAMQAIFTQFDNWNLDALGNEFNSASPPIGPVVGYDYSTLNGTVGFKILTP